MASREVRALTDFYSMLSDDPARAFYGPGHVAAAADLGAIQTLLITDSVFRVNNVEKRRKVTKLVEGEAAPTAAAAPTTPPPPAAASPPPTASAAPAFVAPSSSCCCCCSFSSSCCCCCRCFYTTLRLLFWPLMAAAAVLAIVLLPLTSPGLLSMPFRRRQGGWRGGPCVLGHACLWAAAGAAHRHRRDPSLPSRGARGPGARGPLVTTPNEGETQHSL